MNCSLVNELQVQADFSNTQIWVNPLVKSFLDNSLPPLNFKVQTGSFVIRFLPITKIVLNFADARKSSFNRKFEIEGAVHRL